MHVLLSAARGFNVNTAYFSLFIESVLTFYFICWFGSHTLKNRNMLDKCFFRWCSKIAGTHLTQSRCQRRPGQSSLTLVTSALTSIYSRAHHHYITLTFHDYSSIILPHPNCETLFIVLYFLSDVLRLAGKSTKAAQFHFATSVSDT